MQILEKKQNPLWSNFIKLATVSQRSSPYSCQAKTEFNLGLAWIGGACLSETVASLIKLFQNGFCFFSNCVRKIIVQLNLQIMEKWKWNWKSSSIGTQDGAKFPFEIAMPLVWESRYGDHFPGMAREVFNGKVSSKSNSEIAPRHSKVHWDAVRGKVFWFSPAKGFI